MVRNYLKIAYRNLVRTKLYSFINVLGLTLGITCSSLLVLYVYDELSFDQTFIDGDRTARLIYESHRNPDNIRQYGVAPAPLSLALKDNFPEVTDHLRLWKFVGHLDFKYGEENYTERDWFMVEENFPQHFSLDFIYGDPSSFADPMSIILSESTSFKIFGKVNPIGETIQDDIIGDLKVTGVFKDLPQNTHLQFEILVTPSRGDDNWVRMMEDYNRVSTYSYLIFDHPASIDPFEGKMNDFVLSKVEEGTPVVFRLQHLKDIHFYSSSVEFGPETNPGEFKYIIIFLSIAVFIILIAVINYMNLATAKSMKRSREIGVRKANGAAKPQLISQFMVEALLISTVSFLFSLGLIDLLIPFFNSITGKSFVFAGDDLTLIIVLTFIFSVIIGMLSGLYPSFYLSNLKPVNILKGDKRLAPSQVNLRKVLVITQFTLSIFMITSTLIVYKQLNFMNNYNLGFNKDRMVVVDINGPGTRNGFKAMKNELLKNNEISKVAVSTRVPGEWKDILETYVRVIGKSDSLQSYYMGFDEDMIPLYEMELVEGQNFEGIESLDSTKVILNETAVKQLGIASDPLGQQLLINVPRAGLMKFQVLGVVKDFNYQSLHSEINPLIIGYWNSPMRVIDYFSVKVSGNNMDETIAYMAKIHEEFEDGTPMEYHFLDSQIDSFYQTEVVVGKVFLFGAGFTIFIACLGLFGLASFLTELRTKELGIRKTLGADFGQLYLMVSYSFVKNVLIAWAIAIPVSILFMNRWLDLFTYRTNLGFTVFVISGLVALVISLLTVSYRSLKAAAVNPVKSLRYE